MLVADPGMIVAESPLGLGDLYVALTRATQRVGVVHAGEPAPGAGRADRGADRGRGCRLSTEHAVVPDAEVA